MTFPQLSSVDPVLNGQQLWRLKTLLASAGDIYESEVSGLAFALGPDSDIAEVLVSYFDPDAATLLSQVTLSPDRDMIGRIDAHNETTYPALGRRGRILISIEDIYDPTWLPEGFDLAHSRITFEAPVLDVFQYFVNPPSLISQRSDKTFRYQYPTIPPDVVNGFTYIVLPAYGRKSGYFTFKNIGNGIVTVPVSILGVRLSTSALPGPVGAAQVSLYANAGILTGDSAAHVFKASTDGLWDYLVIALGNGAGFGYPGGPFPISVTLSDDPQ